MRYALASIALAIAFVGSAAAEDLPKQFDLLCDTSGNPAKIEFPRHLHIDLASGAWCENACSVSHGGANIVDKDLILEVKVREFDTGYKSTEIQSINADTLNFFGISQAEKGGRFIYKFVVVGSCRRVTFTGVTGPLAPW